MLFLAQRGSITDVSDAWPTFQQVLDAMLLRAGHNTTVVIIGTTLLGIAAGIVGVFGLLRKRALMADALAHATLPGIGLAFIAATVLGFEGRSLPVLLLGGAITGVMGVGCIQLLLRHTRLKEDAAIGIVLSVFFGAGIVILSYIQSMHSGNQGGLKSFIYGQTAAMSAGDAMLMGGIALAAVVVTFLLFKEFALVGFNDAFARVGGWPVTFIDLMMMALVVAVTVAGLQAVGLILVVAMLIIPPVAARFWTERLRTLVILAAVIGGLSGYFGSIVSALLPRKPAGSVIVLTSGVLFVVSMFVAPARGVLAMSFRRARLRLRIAGEHVLEEAFERESGVLEHGTLRRLAKMRGWTFLFRGVVLCSLRMDRRIVKTPQGVALTDAGREDGARVSRNHKLWEQYLISYAAIAPSHVDWSVDQVEHVLSDELVRELVQALRDRGVAVPEGGRAA